MLKKIFSALTFFKESPATHRDIVIATTVVLLVFILCWHWNVAKELSQLSMRYESMHLDELPLELFTVAMAGLWFSRRRMREIKLEAERRALAENELSRLLHENRALAEHARQIQESERKRMVREIHDDVGQYLTAIRLDATALSKVEDTITSSHASRIALNAEHVQTTIKALLHRLRPIALDKYGLIEAVQHLLHEWEQQQPGTACHFSSDETCQNLPDAVNTAAYRIIQEALTNVARHAQASKVFVAIRLLSDASGKALLVIIHDNGIGFEPKQPGQKGFGLVGMRERVAAVGGTFSLRTSHGHGTNLSAKLPL